MKLIKILGLLTFFVPNLLAISATEVQGIYSVFKPSFTEYSHINGFSWWHNKIAENMFKYGNQKDYTIQLTHLLFTQLGTAFYPTRGILQPAYYFTADTISKLMIELTRFWKSLKDNENSILIEEWRTTPKKRQLIEEKITRETTSKLTSIIKEATAQVTISAQKIRELVATMVRSLLEQLPTTTKTGKYLPYTTHALLLAFLEAKTNNKKDLLPYMDTIAKKTNAIKDIETWQKEFNTDFDKQRLADFWNKLITAQDPITIDPSHYELAIASAYFYSIQSKAYPPMIQWQKATYGDFEPFPDCGETSARNFVNILTYDQTTGTFNSDKLTNNKLLTIPKELITFYAQYPRVDQASRIIASTPDTPEVNPYIDWSMLVQNLEGIIYAKGNVCEIHAGLSNMLKVLNHLLLGNNQEFLNKSKQEQLNYLVKVLSTPHLQLSWQVKNGTADEVDKKDIDVALLFTVQIPETEPYDFEWQFQKGHFAIPAIQDKNSSPTTQLVINQLQTKPIQRDPFIALNISGFLMNWTYSRKVIQQILDFTKLPSQFPTIAPGLTRQLFFTLLKSRHYPNNLANIVDIFTKPGHITLPAEIYTLLKELNDAQIIAQYIPILIENNAVEIVKNLLNDQQTQENRNKLWERIIATTAMYRKKEFVKLCSAGIQEMITASNTDALITALGDMYPSPLFEKEIVGILDTLIANTSSFSDSQREKLEQTMYQIVLLASYNKRNAQNIIAHSITTKVITPPGKTIRILLAKSIIQLNTQGVFDPLLTEDIKHEFSDHVAELSKRKNITELVTLLEAFTRFKNDSALPFINQIIAALSSQEVLNDRRIITIIDNIVGSKQTKLYPLVKTLISLTPPRAKVRALLHTIDKIRHESIDPEVLAIANDAAQQIADKQKAFELLYETADARYYLFNSKTVAILWNILTNDQKTSLLNRYESVHTSIKKELYQAVLPTLNSIHDKTAKKELYKRIYNAIYSEGMLIWSDTEKKIYSGSRVSQNNRKY